MDNENYWGDLFIENTRKIYGFECSKIRPRFLVELLENKDGSYTIRANCHVKVEPGYPLKDSIWITEWSLHPWR